MSRERTFRSEGIILRRRDFGEADRVLTIFTRKHGKLEAIAKGARKPQSRKTGHVELFMRTNFLFAQGRNLPIITQAELVESYAALRTDLLRVTYAAYIAELFDQFTVDNEANDSLYHLLAQAFSWCATTGDLMLMARYYELRLLRLTGFQPQLFQCVGSGDKIVEQDQYFSAELGGALSPEHRHEDPRAKAVSSVGLKVLRYLQTRDWSTVSQLTIREALNNELEVILRYYLTYLLERRLKSVAFLGRLRMEPPYSPAEEP